MLSGSVAFLPLDRLIHLPVCLSCTHSHSLASHTRFRSHASLNLTSFRHCASSPLLVYAQRPSAPLGLHSRSPPFAVHQTIPSPPGPSRPTPRALRNARAQTRTQPVHATSPPCCPPSWSSSPFMLSLISFWHISTPARRAYTAPGVGGTKARRTRRTWLLLWLARAEARR